MQPAQVAIKNEKRQPESCLFYASEAGARLLCDLLAHGRHVRARTVGHFSGYADGFTQGWVGVDGLADVHGVSTHFGSQRDFTDHVAAQNAAMAMPLGESSDSKPKPMP